RTCARRAHQMTGPALLEREDRARLHLEATAGVSADTVAGVGDLLRHHPARARFVHRPLSGGPAHEPGHVGAHPRAAWPRPPLREQYLMWMEGIVTRGDFGHSFGANRPVTSVIGEKLWWTVAVAGITML